VNRRNFLKSIIGAGTATLLAGAVYAHQSSNLEISHERLAISKLKRRMRIIAVSDVHAPCFNSPIEDLLNIINTASPDIFILAGDIVDRKDNEDLVGMFKQVKARFAKIAALGNWEYLVKLDLVKLKTEYDNAGISLLVNNIIEVKGLMIVGLDDFVLGSPDYKIVSDVSIDQHPILVVSHCPESFDFLTSFSKSPVIVLSGHTHGGQIAPFGIVLSTPLGSGSYVQGWYHKGKHSMYVMRGIGTTPGLPIRIGARPELLVLDIEGA